MKKFCLWMIAMSAMIVLTAPVVAEDQAKASASQEASAGSLPEPMKMPSALTDPAATGVVRAQRSLTQESKAAQPADVSGSEAKKSSLGEGYLVGINDMLEISVLEPEVITRQVKVAPDGTITFPYIGSVPVRGLDIPQIQKNIQDLLANGYLKFPVVLVALQASNSKMYMVYGEITRPGSYPLEEYSTVMRAISVGGGFTKFGSSSRVKILRPRPNALGYDTIKINMDKVMSGDSTEDVQLKAGDMVVVSEGVF